jgi:predicted nucleotide-binding protein (sugar kinase/HSP70/actin superfamily)
LLRTAGGVPGEIREGIRDGYREQAGLAAFLRAAGMDAVERVEKAGADAIILLGRPYNLYDRTSTSTSPRSCATSTART